MTSQEEEYIHLSYCMEDMNNARITLKAILNRKVDPVILNAAFKYAIVEYAKSYINSRGVIKRDYKLDKKYLPVKYHKLHDRLINIRHQVLAHSDLTVKEARLFVSETKQGKITGRIENNIKGNEELSNIDSIIDLIEETLDKVYVKIDELEKIIPVNSN